MPGGPWTRLFAGTWSGFNVAVYENEDRILLTTIFPKSGEINWVMIRVDKVLLVPEGIDKLSKELESRHLHIIKQQFPDRSMAFILLPALPTTVEFGSKTINAEVMDKIVKLEDETNEINKIAKKMKVSVLDLKDASYGDSAAIMGNPPLLLSLLNISPEPGEEVKKQRLTEVPIGKDEKGIFKIGEPFFDTFMSVRRGKDEERSYAAQMIVESAILDPSPIPIVLDFNESPLRLDQSNPYPYDYSEYGIESSNTPFEFETYDLSQPDCPFKIDLNEVSQQYLWHLLGIGKDESSSVIIQAYYALRKSGKLDSLSTLVEEVKKTPCSNERDKFHVSRAVRILGAAQRAYGPIFKKQDSKSMVEGWIKKNKPAYLRLASMGHRPRIAFMLYLSELLEELQESPGLSIIEKRRVEHVFLAFLGIDWFSDGILESQFVQAMVNTKAGALFEGGEGLPMELESRISYKFNVTGLGQVKLQIGGRSKNIELRPLLSCPP